MIGCPAEPSSACTQTLSTPFSRTGYAMPFPSGVNCTPPERWGLASTSRGEVSKFEIQEGDLFRGSLCSRVYQVNCIGQNPPVCRNTHFSAQRVAMKSYLPELVRLRPSHPARRAKCGPTRLRSNTPISGRVSTREEDQVFHSSAVPDLSHRDSCARCVRNSSCHETATRKQCVGCHKRRPHASRHCHQPIAVAKSFLPTLPSTAEPRRSPAAFRRLSRLKLSMSRASEGSASNFADALPAPVRR